VKEEKGAKGQDDMMNQGQDVTGKKRHQEAVDQTEMIILHSTR